MMQALTLALLPEAIEDAANLTLEQARRQARTPLTSVQRAARDMYQGDHLGSLSTHGQYAYWRGPVFTLDDTQGDNKEASAFVRDFRNALQRSFTSTNFIHELLEREVGVSIARMTWDQLPAEQAALLELWWKLDSTRVEHVIREAITTARREGRGVLRFRVAAPKVAPTTPEAAARFIRLETLPPESARVVEHPDTLERVGLYAYTWQNIDAAEISALDDQGRTVLRVLRGNQPVDAGTPFDLGGRLTLIEVTLPALITEQILQNQMGYNTVATLALRNTELAGFVERFGIGIEPPYILEDDPQHPGQKVRKYLPVKVGGGRMNLWARSTYDKTDAKGNYLGEEPTPGGGEYGRLEPTSAEPLMSAAEMFRRNIYGEAGQMFVLMNSSGDVSGRSREIAMSDFDARREVVRDAARYLITEVAETALALMYALSGKSRPAVQVVGQVQGRAIPQSAEERAADLGDLAVGVMTAGEVRARRGLDELPSSTGPPETPPG
ncbi:hypothetical protein HLB42_09680 [Deinococcus sp. D7000]|nr:hypothetical protein HLB42_09680 [Deinococcus sp. D7000]